MNTKKNAKIGYILILIAVLTWSFSEILQKLLQDSVPPMSKSFLRFFIGIMPLILILMFQKDLKMWELFKRNYKEFIIAGVFGFGIGNFVYFLGIERTQANIGSAIYGSYPIFISIYSIFILDERKNLKTRSIGYIIGILSIIMLGTNLDFSGLIESENLLGNFLVLLGSMIWSIFSVLGKKITSRERENFDNIDLKLNIITMSLAGLTNLFFIFFMPEELNTFFQYSLDTWGLLIFLGVITTGLGTWLFFVGVQNIEMSKGISFAMLKPIFVIILAFIILGETPTFLLIITLPLILFSIYLVNKK